MNQRMFIIWSTATILFFIFASIYQYNRVVKLNYTLQKIEKEKIKLTKLLDQQKTRICALRDARSVKAEATKTLGLSPVKLSQLMTLDTTTTCAVEVVRV